MAVVFISPKQRQKTFFLGITVLFILFLAVMSLGVFSAEPSEVSSGLVFNKPKVNIDMSVFDSGQFKNLEPFVEMQNQYSYKAVSQTKQVESGFVTAASMDQAIAILTGEGLSVLQITEAQIGRDNPFIPYYETATPAVTAPAKVTQTPSAPVVTKPVVPMATTPSTQNNTSSGNGNT